MSDAVGLKDLFSYGLRFVGYLSLVVLVGGGPLVAGYALITIRGPGFGALTGSSELTVTLMGGAAIAVVGAVTLASGFIGVLHKLVADAAMTGTETALTADTEPPADESVDTEPAPDDAEAEAGTADGTTSAESDTAEPDEPLEAEPPSEAASSTTEAAETRLVEDDPGQSNENDDAADDGDLIAESDEHETGTAEAPPEEWSPPDPSEFEFDGDGSGETVDDDAASDTATDGPDDTDRQEDTDDTPRTAADLFGDTEDEETEAFESTDDVETIDADSESDPLSDALEDE